MKIIYRWLSQMPQRDVPGAALLWVSSCHEYPWGRCVAVCLGSCLSGSVQSSALHCACCEGGLTKEDKYLKQLTSGGKALTRCQLCMTDEIPHTCHRRWKHAWAPHGACKAAVLSRWGKAEILTFFLNADWSCRTRYNWKKPSVIKWMKKVLCS